MLKSINEEVLHMSELPSAKQSPRIINGVLKWYLGDTFDLDIRLSLIDQENEDYIIGPDDTVETVFRDATGDIVKTFTQTGIGDNTITLDFNAETTALFDRGKYTYDIYLNSLERTTLANDNEAVVE
jgi:hypothetical protein